MTLKEIGLAYGVDAKLLKRYFQAFSNLYGICSLQKAMNIIKRQNPELNLSEKQFLGFADNYAGDWKIVSPDEVYSDAPVTTHMRREIVSKQLVFYNDYGSYYTVRGHQADKDFYIPAKNELLKYAQKEYYEENLYTDSMARFLEKELQLEDWREKLTEVVLSLRLDLFDVQYFLDSLGGKLLVYKTIEKAVEIYSNLHNNTRLMTNRGYTPNELSRRYNPQGAMPTSVSFGPGIQKLIQSGQMNADDLVKGFAAMDIPTALKASLISETDKAKQSKPGRNDPCPCGSGKKYKKCCGR